MDITNLDTTNLAPKDSTAVYQQDVIVSSQNMFSLAQASLEENPSLSKVIIMEHPPRFDIKDVDPTSLKHNLVKLANSTLNQLWLNSHLKDKIFIGHHSLESYGVGASHLARYKSQAGRYDGVHFYGAAGCADYSSSVINIFSMALPIQEATTSGCGTAKDNHSRCPQAKYQEKTKYHVSVKTQNRFGLFSSNSGNY